MSNLATSPPARPSPWAPLRHKVFMALWIAQIASNIGTWMQNVGAAWLMGDLRASPTLIALVQTAITLPVFLVGIPAGALADILDRRRMLIATQGIMLAAALGLAALTFADAITPASLLGLTFLLGLGGALNLPAWQAIQPELVPRRELGQAVALGALAFNLGRAVGPALGGLVVAAAGPGWVFALNAVSFVGTMGVLVWWRRPVSEDLLPAESLAGAMRAGLRYGINSPALRAVLVRSASLVIPAAAVLALLPIVARDQLGLGSGGYGLLLGAFGIGAASSAVLRPRLEAVLSTEQLVVVSGVVMAACLVVEAFVPVAWVVGLALLFAGAAWTTALTTTSVAAQGALPGWVRARGMGLYVIAVNGGVAIGSALWGTMAGWSLAGAQVVAAVALLIGLSTAWRWGVSEPQRLDMSPVSLADPVVAMMPHPDDGPVLVTVPYWVPPGDVEDFTLTMRRIERVRRRTGAYQWGLFRDLTTPDRFLETYLIESWAEHLRQRQRLTATDLANHHSVQQFREEDAAVTRYISTYHLHPAPPPDA